MAEFIEVPTTGRADQKSGSPIKKLPRTLGWRAFAVFALAEGLRKSAKALAADLALAYRGILGGATTR